MSEYDYDRLSSPVPVSEGSQVSGEEVGPVGTGPNLAATGAGAAAVPPVPVVAQPQPEINWTLINDLATKPHPLLHIANFEPELPLGVGEVMEEARTAHHLLDLIKIPHGTGYANNIDARTYLAVRQILALRERLDRIQSWHSRETAEAGMVGDFCNECGEAWPCDTRRMAEGTYVDDEPIETPEQSAAIVDANLRAMGSQGLEPAWGSGPLVDHNPETPVRISIDRRSYEVAPQPLTGLQLRLLPSAPIATERDLWQVMPGEPDRLIADDDVIRMGNGLRFFSVPRYVNASADLVDHNLETPAGAKPREPVAGSPTAAGAREADPASLGLGVGSAAPDGLRTQREMDADLYENWVTNQEAGAGSADPDGGRYPRFSPETVLVVDAHSGPEQWTGQRWNDYVAAAERTQSMVTARLLEVDEGAHAPGTGSADPDGSRYPAKYGYCAQCGAESGQSCHYMFGDGTANQEPNSVRPEPHFYRDSPDDDPNWRNLSAYKGSGTGSADPDGGQ